MITFGHDCPYCKKKNVAFEVNDFSRRERMKNGKDVFAILGTCNHCGGGVVTNILVSNIRRDLGHSPSESEFIHSLMEKHAQNKYTLKEIFPDQNFVFYPLPPKLETVAIQLDN